MSARERRERARARLGALEALLVTAPVNVRWLTGLAASRAALLLRRDGTDALCVDGRYEQQAGESAPDLEVVVDRGDGWLAGRLPGGALLGVEDDRVSWRRVESLRAALGGAQVVAAGGRVEAERLRKDAAELRSLRVACEITAAALAAVWERLRPGLAELEVARMVEDALRDAGADDRAFATIVASGPNGSRPHHAPGDRKLEAGDLVTIDAGALVDGYHADMTRTVALGEPDPRLAEAYEAVRQAQAAGVAAVRADVTAGSIDDATRRVLAEAGLAGAIRHPTGHGVGLEVHESPILRSEETATLPAGAVVTVEPGAYLPGLGGVRIEDTVAVTAEGRDVLTAAPTELLTL